MTAFSVWAPKAGNVNLVIDGERLAMTESSRAGWWELDVPSAGHGTDYAFSIDGGPPRPDPRSTWQPHGVHKSSRSYDHARFEWTDGSWHGVPLTGSVLYEMHVGTFTSEGTFDAAIERLDHLVDLGVTAVEVLPVASYDGTHGWGYDGVALYAVHEPYGGPDGFKRFVDACHARGLGVVLDVVYNHLGPSGNYLADFGPYFTNHYSTPWGPALNYSRGYSDEVRRWAIDNALMWLRDFHVDGLRLDAVHEIVDTRAVHLLEQLSTEVDELATHVGRPLFLIAETDLNDPRLITGRDAHGYGLTGQWCDDVHHALHAFLADEQQGYYVDFGSLATLARSLSSPYHHEGTWSTFRKRTHGRPLDRSTTPGYRFVTYLENHDQVGNRATGDRLAAHVSTGRLMIGAALLFCSPYTPMLFMGEEWGASTPWQFFTSFPDAKLAQAVRDGRRREFAAHGWGEDEVPDPQDVATFERSKLDWAELDKDDHRELLEWHRRLIALRREHAELADPALTAVRTAYDQDGRWLVLYRGRIAVACNFATERAAVPIDGRPDGVLASSVGGFVFRPGEIELDPESVCLLTVA
jgi:maltooligosyltrehalose trehalohydrolase